MRAFVGSGALCVCFAVSFLARIAPAESAAADPNALGAGEHRVDFRADRVELEPDEGALELEGDVAVRSSRFQITSEQITLSRSPRGVHVEGGGRLAFCRCKDPPVTLGFSAADLAPPTDVLLEDATLRIAGVPVFYSPFLWLRARDRLGLLPPLAMYRGEEGWLAGAGVHVPFARDSAPQSALDLRAAGYLRGGARVDLRLQGSGGHAEAAWDQFRGSGFELRSDFATTDRSRATLAGRADALAGERARDAPFAIDTVARPSDRLKVGVGSARFASFGFALESTRERGAALSEPGLFGPALELGLGAALGRRARFGASFGTFAARRPEGGAASQSSFASELSGALPWGPSLAELLLRGRGEATTLESGYAAQSGAELRFRLGLPLVKRTGQLVHRVEPWLEAAAGAQGAIGGGEPDAWSADRGALDTHTATALTGFETAVGTERTAFDARVGAGVAGSADVQELAVAARTRLDVRAARFSAEARALPDDGALDAFLHAAFGEPDSLRAGVLVEGARGDAAVAHQLFVEDWLAPRGAFYDRSGLGAGARVGVPWGYGFDSELSAEFDVTSERFLAGTAALGYRHPCRCLDLRMWGGRRLGRDGFDLAFSLDLVP